MKKVLFLFICFILINSNRAQEFLTLQSTDPKVNISLIKRSIYNDLYDKNNQQKHSALNLFAQEVVGVASGIGLALPSYYLSKVDRLAANGKENLAIFSLISYVIGSGVGVYLIADLENPNISFWETIGYAIIGGGTSFLILNATFDERNILPIGIISFLILPTLSSMIYASYIADWNNEINTSIKNNALKNHSYLVENSKLFNVELWRVYF